MSQDGIKALAGALQAGPELAKSIYSDGASGGLQEVGGLLTDLIKTARLFTAPIQVTAHLQDRLSNYFQQALKSVPESQQISPPPSLLLHLASKLKYQDEADSLTSLYIELLKRACDKDRVNEAHPAFINIIPQLSLDEVLILFYFSSAGNTGKYFLALKKGALNKVMNHLPLNDIEQPSSSKAGFTMKSSAIISNLFQMQVLVEPKYTDLYLSHLKSLNLIELQKSPGIVNFRIDQEDIESGRLHKKELIRYKLTLFGELFAKACIPETFDLTDP
jgi:hypothetical protein